MTAPLASRGVVDDGAALSKWSQTYGDIFELVPDLFHPTSVYTYGHMRRDPQLTAILRALTLPVRRATWQINGDGCRPEVVALVADDLGLPVVGADNQPTGARVRGVKWRDHLRRALLREVFGYMVFEHRYEIRDGKARLIALGDRMPQTWLDVATDSDGNMISAKQNMVPGRGDPTDIPATSLTWHVREQEGSNWWGTSALRESYPAWLIKREMQRVLATSNRRFGIGVPNMQALPGTQPTPGQMIEAQRYASAITGGQQSGGATPPGFQLELLGITGNVPDTLAFIRFLNQEMSRTALAGFLDLGESANGSRALGAEFVDLFLLLDQQLADDVAAAETEQTVARMVAWNWGEDEPVPAIEVADVGSRREVTAEALKALLDGGALSADPELEAWVRREYRLPAREESDTAPPSTPIFSYDLQYQTATVNERRAQLGLPPVPGGDSFPTAPAQPAAGDPAPPALPTATPRPARVPSAAVDSMPVRRQPSTIEAAAGTDFGAVASTWTAAVDQLVTDWASIGEAQRRSVLEQITAAVNDGELDALATLAVDSEDAAVLLAGRMHELADAAAATMRDEAKGQGVKPPAAAPDKDRLTGLAGVFAGLLAGGYAASAARKAAQAWTAGANATDVADAVGAHLDSLTDSTLRDGLGAAASAAQNEGRLAVLRAAPAATYYASEIHDANACKPCLAVDGSKFDNLAAAEAAYANGAYRECLGGLRCRGIPIAVWGTT